MSKEEKAEQRALEAYPVLMCYNDFQMVEEDINKPIREIYQEGYHQAEKDLELTWKDIEKICLIAKESHKFYGFWSKIVYDDILKRFKERRIV